MADHYLKQELYEILQNDTTIFKFLQEGALDGVWYWDLEKPENEWMSPRFWEVLGLDPKKKKHLASEWQDLIFPEDLETAIENFEKHCTDENHPYDQIVRYKHKDGSTVWVRCRGIAIRDKNGKPLRMLGAHNDITHLKRAEQQLIQKTELLEKAESELKDKSAFLDRVLETSALSTWIADKDGTAIRTNHACLDFFGTTEEEVIGKYNLFKDAELERGGNMPEIRRLFKEKVPVRFVQEYDFGKVGHVDVKNPTKTIVHTILTPILDEKGDVANVIVQGMDLTHMKRNEEELRQEKERIQNIGDNIPSGHVFQLLILPDGTRRFTHVGRQVEELYECSVEEALKDSGFIYNRMLEEDNARIRKASAQAFRDGKNFDQEFRVRMNSGEIRWHRAVANPLGLEDGSILFDGIDIDVTEQKLAGQEREALLEELKEKNVQLEHAATHDFLTGLPNRVLLYDRFLQNASMCRRSGMKMGICIADTDDFKVINDTYGHQEGDRVLKEIGSRIQPSLREYDTTARLGGDEFALLLLNVREKKEIDKIMKRMLKNANQQIPVGKKFVQVSMSVGIAVYPDDGETLDDLLGKADKAMYQAKDSGGNRYLFFQQEK